MNNDSQLDFFIKNMAQQHQPDLSGPGLIWWRAQIRKKMADKERIERPVVIMRAIALLVCLAVLVGFLALNWRQISSAINGGLVPWMMIGLVSVAGLAVMTSLLFRESSHRD